MSSPCPSLWREPVRVARVIAFQNRSLYLQINEAELNQLTDAAVTHCTPHIKAFVCFNEKWMAHLYEQVVNASCLQTRIRIGEFWFAVMQCLERMRDYQGVSIICCVLGFMTDILSKQSNGVIPLSEKLKPYGRVQCSQVVGEIIGHEPPYVKDFSQVLLSDRPVLPDPIVWPIGLLKRGVISAKHDMKKQHRHFSQTRIVSILRESQYRMRHESIVVSLEEVTAWRDHMKRYTITQEKSEHRSILFHLRCYTDNVVLAVEKATLLFSAAYQIDEAILAVNTILGCIDSLLRQANNDYPAPTFFSRVLFETLDHVHDMLEQIENKSWFRKCFFYRRPDTRLTEMKRHFHRIQARIECGYLGNGSIHAVSKMRFSRQLMD
jgi:hypothetical protein